MSLALSDFDSSVAVQAPADPSMDTGGDAPIAFDGQAVPATDPTTSAASDPYEPDDSGPGQDAPPSVFDDRAHRADTARLAELASFVGRFVPHPSHTVNLGSMGDGIKLADHSVPPDILKLRWEAIRAALASILAIAIRSGMPPDSKP